MIEKGHGWLLSGSSIIAVVEYETDSAKFTGRLLASAETFARANGPFMLLDANKRQWAIELTEAPRPDANWLGMTIRAA